MLKYKILFFLIVLVTINIASASIVYTGTHWDTVGSTPIAITMNSSFFWVVNNNDAEVYKYYHNGTYTDDHWDIGADGISHPRGITMNTSYIWITDWNDAEVYKYYHNGTYTGDHFDTAGNGPYPGNGAPYGITMNATYFWITDSWPLCKKVYQYHHNGTYTGTCWFTINANQKPWGITMNSSYLWIIDSEDDEVYKYYHDGTYTGDHWDTHNTGNDLYSITMNTSYFWLADWDSDEVYQYRNNEKPTMSNLLTENQTNPTKIETNASSPYFTWSYSDSDGDAQNTYEIYIGTSSGLSDMWNSGTVVSTSTSATYAGSTLEQGIPYYIQIRTKDWYENSDWLTGTFELKDTTTYLPPPPSPPSGGKSDIEIISERLGTTEVITEKITEVLTETDSMIFVLYLLAAILGALVFAVLSSEDGIVTILFVGTIAWVLVLILMFMNNLFKFFVADTVLMMIIAVVFGLLSYVVYNFWKGESKSKTKPTRRKPK